MANFCENCGSPLKSENKFCPNCGAPIKQTEAAAPAAATTPSSFPENASANTSPINTPAVNPSTTSAVPGTSSAVTGAAGAAAVRGYRRIDGPAGFADPRIHRRRDLRVLKKRSCCSRKGEQQLLFVMRLLDGPLVSYEEDCNGARPAVGGDDRADVADTDR